MNTLAQDNPNVLIVAATNNLDGIDPALVRSGRFDHKVYVPMPDEDARQQIVSTVVANSILRQETEDFRVFGDDLNVVKLATETDGMSGADITEIFRRLGLTRAMQEARTGQQQEPIKQDEIIQEIRKFRTVG
jgi:transitional endoplasmic reticulum ATPase